MVGEGVCRINPTHDVAVACPFSHKVDRQEVLPEVATARMSLCMSAHRAAVSFVSRFWPLRLANFLQPFKIDGSWLQVADLPQ